MNPSPYTDAVEAQLLDAVRDLYDVTDPVPADLAERSSAALGAQPVEYTVARFKCPFCGRSRSSRKPIVEHIGRCWKNPAVKACLSCRHFDVQPTEIEVGARGAEWCGAQDAELERITVHCPLWTLRDGAA